VFTERTSVGLDVHARSVAAAAIDGVTGELIQAKLTPSYEHIRSWIGGLPGPVAVAYEAGPTGFGLHRFLTAAGTRCLVAAPSKLQKPSGDRVKTDLLFRYAYALDERDWAGLESCFTPEVVFRYGGPDTNGYAAVEAALRAGLEPLTASQHLVGNVTVALGDDGKTATSSCYVQGQHVRLGVAGGDQLLLGGRYADRLIHATNGWRIAERALDVLRTTGNGAVIGL